MSSMECGTRTGRFTNVRWPHANSNIALMASHATAAIVLICATYWCASFSPATVVRTEAEYPRTESGTPMRDATAEMKCMRRCAMSVGGCGGAAVAL